MHPLVFTRRPAGLALRLLLPLTLALAACASERASAEAPHRYELAFTEADALTAAALERDLDAGIEATESFFRLPFPAAFRVDVLPDRDAFTRSFPAEWGMTETECWMVAAGVGDALRILSPRVWTTDACEHDPADSAHVRGIVTHELVHVLHDQINPTPEFVGAEEIGWFLEGVAVLASGQLAQGHMDGAIAAVRAGQVPQELEQAWSGPHRYGIAGSLALFVDETLGRDGTVALLTATREEEILAALGMTEPELLERWAAFVLARAEG